MGNSEPSLRPALRSMKSPLDFVADSSPLPSRPIDVVFVALLVVERGQRPTDDLVRVIAEHILRGAVPEHDVAIGVAGHDGVLGGIGDGAEPALASGQTPPVPEEQHCQPDNDGTGEKAGSDGQLPRPRQPGVGFRYVQLRDNAEAQKSVPCPGADHGHAPIVPISRDIQAGFARDRALGHAGQRQPVARHVRQAACRHVHARIADEDVQDCPLLLSDQADLPELVVEPAFAEQPAFAVERVGLSRLADTSALQDGGERARRVDVQDQGGDRLPVLVPDGRPDVHLRLQIVFVPDRRRLRNRRPFGQADHRLTGKHSIEVQRGTRQRPADAVGFAVVGDQYPAVRADHGVAGISMLPHHRIQMLSDHRARGVRLDFSAGDIPRGQLLGGAANVRQLGPGPGVGKLPFAPIVQRQLGGFENRCQRVAGVPPGADVDLIQGEPGQQGDADDGHGHGEEKRSRFRERIQSLAAEGLPGGARMRGDVCVCVCVHRHNLAGPCGRGRIAGGGMLSASRFGPRLFRSVP